MAVRFESARLDRTGEAHSASQTSQLDLAVTSRRRGEKRIIKGGEEEREAAEGEESKIDPNKGGLDLPSLKCGFPQASWLRPSPPISPRSLISLTLQ